MYSSYGSSSYTNMSGTSMAAPHVTGTIALMFQKNATLDFTQVYNILLDYADRPAPDCNSIPNNNCGWGRLNALRAVENTPSSSVPYIALSRVFVDDAAGNNNNIADPGETVNLIITLRNSGGGAANNTQATIYTSNPYITIIDNSAVYGNIAPSDSATNTSDVFTISVSPSAPIGLSVRFDMYVSANSGGYNDTLNFTLTIGNPVDVFVIDTGTAALWIPVNQPGGIGTHYGDTTTAKGFKYPKTGQIYCITPAWPLEIPRHMSRMAGMTGEIYQDITVDLLDQHLCLGMKTVPLGMTIRGIQHLLALN